MDKVNNNKQTGFRRKINNAVIKRSKKKLIRSKVKINKHVAYETPYKQALLSPELAVQAKIPGGAVPVVSLHRKIVTRQTTNASGNFAAQIICDKIIRDNATAFAPLWFVNDALYNGSATVAAVPAIAYNNPFNLPAGIARSVRTVSVSVLVRSLASPLNRTGDIHIALVNGQADTVTNNQSADMMNYEVLANMTNIGGTRYAKHT